MKNNILFQEDWYNLMKDMPALSFGNVLKALMESRFEGKEIDITAFEPMERMVLNFLLPKIKEAASNYQEICRKKHDASRSYWGKRNKSDDNHKVSDDNHKVSDDNHKVSDDNHKVSDDNHKVSDDNHKVSDDNHKVSDDNLKNNDIKNNDIKNNDIKNNDNNGDTIVSLDANASPDTPRGFVEGKNGEKIDIAKFVEFWNETVKDTLVPQIRTFSKARKAMLKARLVEYGKQTIFDIIETIPKSDFLSGRKSDFHATFDFVFGARNFPKVLDGNYDNNTNDNTNDHATHISNSYQAELAAKQQRIQSAYNVMQSFNEDSLRREQEIARQRADFIRDFQSQ